MVSSNKKLKITLDEGAFLPTRGNPTDAGLDIFARESAVVPARGSKVFATGVHIELPEISFEGLHGCMKFNTVAIVKPRSGLNFMHDIFTDGTIDMDYRGEIKVKLYNLGDKDYEIKRGNRIAQLVITLALTPEAVQVEELSETDRGAGGFGSTGK